MSHNAMYTEDNFNIWINLIICLFVFLLLHKVIGDRVICIRSGAHLFIVQ